MQKSSPDFDWLTPDWAVPAKVRAVTTSRSGGVSETPWNSFNLATHVGDALAQVLENRRRLQQVLALPAEPLWLEQVHGTEVADVSEAHQNETADAAVAFSPRQVCVVMTADCLPVLFTDRAGSCVAAAHAGWRGLLNGVLEATIQKMNTAPGDLLAWLGPAIGPDAFEVGAEVRDAFVQRSPEGVAAFTGSERSGRYFADIYTLARQRLHALGLTSISGGDHCTYTEAERFFSYRRDGQCGRMASLIWMEE